MIFCLHIQTLNQTYIKQLDDVRKEFETANKQFDSVSRERDLAQKSFVKATGQTQKQMGLVKVADQAKKNLEQEIAGYKDEASKMRKVSTNTIN